MSCTATPIALCLATICLNPVEDVAEDRVDLVELNHFHDEQGRHVFDQLIFYDWNPRSCHYDVRAWRLIKHRSQMPLRDWQRGGYVTLWQDGPLLRRVHAETMRETSTQYDPELIERAFLPKAERRELRRIVTQRRLEP